MQHSTYLHGAGNACDSGNSLLDRPLRQAEKPSTLYEPQDIVPPGSNYQSQPRIPTLILPDNSFSPKSPAASSYRLEEFEAWVRGGEWKELFSLRNILSVEAEETNETGIPDGLQSLTKAQNLADDHHWEVSVTLTERDIMVEAEMEENLDALRKKHKRGGAEAMTPWTRKEKRAVQCKSTEFVNPADDSDYPDYHPDSPSHGRGD
ncbi:hypothetical protein QBC32DRAFT_320085 [Pseudoneurospora amorphoporcata]|uniref:Uncharacterized protein n=1 Tax=Pseudoneurospora amorphoporcata TaxID=241081 RepID=A0AAN6NM00_9PEZI|nr:hypothetical protein QBC32DRAFT_320085 [Pseudoneurospora amorphoporcata]